jgi:Ca2+/H+ antiporter, TMEM165/GDT1 family
MRECVDPLLPDRFQVLDRNNWGGRTMMDIAIGAAWTPMLAAFLASLVEFVEALTVVLAVGTVRGWRPALVGTGLALAVLVGLVVVVGPALTRIPLVLVQFGVGTLLLLFGLRWLRKAILRGAGVIALHDEDAAFAEETAVLQRQGRNLSAGMDKVALAAAFKIVMLEGIEVVFIVIAIGAAGEMLLPASIGALAALALVILLGIVVHRPLASVPENPLKFAVGVLLSAFGTFWAGEGIGVVWPGSDTAILVLIAGFLAMGLLFVPLARASAGRGIL